MITPKDISFLPKSPGCYLFKDDTGTVLYVGKANNIQKRVSSYFQKKDHEPKTALLVTKIKKIDFIVTKSEVEAFLLENNLIKKYYPHYNLDLKDSRRYAYLRLTTDEFPSLETARIRDKGGEYFGPFVSGYERKVVQDTINRYFKIFYKKPTPQVQKLMSKEEYAKRVAQARKILKGNTDELLAELESEMKIASSKSNFEYALTLREQIKALNSLQEKQRMESTKSIDSHVINYSISGKESENGEVHLLLFNIRKGIVEDKQEFEFPYSETSIEEFLTQLYDTTKVPTEIILPHKVSTALEEFIEKKANHPVKILVPKSGEKKALLDFVETNITATFFAGSERINSLQEALKLEKTPRTIECFDISHLSGTNTVASMVTFTNGFPDKSLYRKFKIRAITNNDDLLAMEEAVRRRYSGTLSKSMKKPDLIVIDGGPTQLNVATKVLRELKYTIPVISLAKQFEEIYIPISKTPITLDKKHKGLQLLQAIRDEAHRFANVYRKVLKKKEIL